MSSLLCPYLVSTYKLVLSVTTNDEDRAAFNDLTTMIAAGDLEGAQSQVIEAATDQGVGFTQSF